MIDATQTSDLNENPSNTAYNNEQVSKKSRFSPTVKGVLIGAVAGSILPVFGTISGAIIGGVAGKVYEKKYCAYA